VQLALHRDAMQVSVSDVRLENVRRPVDGAVVGRDDEIDAQIQVMPDLCLDDVRLIPNDERLDEFHERLRMTSGV
jgi:hypothetical protein